MNKERLGFSLSTASPVWFVSFPTDHTRPLMDVIQEHTGTKAHPRRQYSSTGVFVYVCACVWEKKCESGYTQ